MIQNDDIRQLRYGVYSLEFALLTCYKSFIIYCLLICAEYKGNFLPVISCFYWTDIKPVEEVIYNNIWLIGL